MAVGLFTLGMLVPWANPIVSTYIHILTETLSRL